MNWKERALHATEGSRFGAILAVAMGKKTAPPCYVSRAAVMGDGAVLADFVDRDGEHHTTAFVGSICDLFENMDGLAEHLKLDNAERAELFAEVKGWIALDCRH